MFIPPQKRRTTSGKSNTYTPSRSTPRSVIYGDQILNVQGRVPGSAENLEGIDHDRDVLGSLEKLHTSSMGTMRSIRSNGSIPTLERVKREESNHSIGSHSQTSSGQLSERSTDIDLVREAVHQKRSLRARKTSESRLSRGNSRSASATTSTEEKLKNIQARPLPDVPEKDPNPPKLQMRINANDEAIEILNTESVREDPIGGPGVNMTLRHENEVTNEKAHLVKPTSNNGFLTVTGTIKRGKNKGECFDVHLKMNRDRLAKIEKEVKAKKSESCFCGLNRGIHILLASLICVPFL